MVKNAEQELKNLKSFSETDFTGEGGDGRHFEQMTLPGTKAAFMAIRHRAKNGPLDMQWYAKYVSMIATAYQATVPGQLSCAPDYFSSPEVDLGDPRNAYMLVVDCACNSGVGGEHYVAAKR